MWKMRERRKLEVEDKGAGKGNCVLSHYLGERLHTGSS